MTEEFDLTKAYAVETPEDNRRLYAEWAASYDRTFIDTHGYVYHESVVAALLAKGQPTGPVLDVGCGTGVVGSELRRQGVAVVDGIDLSPEMLDVAATKQTVNGEAVYRHLLAADLTEPMPPSVTAVTAGAKYSAVVSTGAFTHGHLGPDPIGMLLDLGAPGAQFALGVNAQHFVTAGFGTWLESAAAAGRLMNLQIVEAAIYDPERYLAADADEHANALSSILLFTRG